MSIDPAGGFLFTPVPTPFSPAPLFTDLLPAYCPTLNCTLNDATCAALSDFYCSTNGWLWAQGAQGVGWSAAAGCYASNLEYGCVAPAEPTQTDYCTFYGLSCSGPSGPCTTANSSCFLSQVWLNGLGTSATSVSIVTPLPANGGPAPAPAPGRAPGNCPLTLSGSSAALGTLSSEEAAPVWNWTETFSSSLTFVTNPFGQVSAVNSGFHSCSVGLANSTLVTNATAAVLTETCIGCFLTGTIPASIGNLISLTSLRLNTGMLFGTVPNALLSLTNLLDLELGGNQFSGSFPSWLGQLTQLTALRIDSNSVPSPFVDPATNGWQNGQPLWTGNLSLDPLCGMVNLQFMYLSQNFAPGRIPDCIGNLSKLRWIDLSVNQLVGTIRESWQSHQRHVHDVGRQSAERHHSVLSGKSDWHLAIRGLLLLHLLL